MYCISQYFAIYCAFYMCCLSGKVYQQLDILQVSGYIYITVGDPSIILILLRITGEALFLCLGKKL